MYPRLLPLNLRCPTPGLSQDLQVGYSRVPCFAAGATLMKWAGGGNLPSRSPGEPVSSQLFPLSCSTVPWVHRALLTRRRATLDRETVVPRRGERALEVRGAAGQVARPPPLLPQQQHTPAVGPRPAEAPGVCLQPTTSKRPEVTEGRHFLPPSLPCH